MDDTDTPARLTYPFDAPPEPGRFAEIADGVFWLRMPLPFRLDHINLYVLRDRDGWTLVDTGIRGRHTRELWEGVFADLFGAAPVRRVIATHMHPDHVGQAGWLTRRFGVELWMTRTEFLMCKMLAVDGPADVPEDAIRFYRRAGFDDHRIDLYQQKFGRFGALIDPLPAGFRRIEDGDRIEIGDAEWEVVIGRGHSPEHACLYSRHHTLLISGDQVLPRISSNVSVFPVEPEANPLSEWLDACHAIPGRVPDDVVVAPAHNEPFRGLHPRLADLVDGHIEGLVRLHEMCETPKRIVDVFPALFRREITDDNLLLATGESQAHVNYLVARGALAAEHGADGVVRYARAGRFEPRHDGALAA